MLLWLSMLGLAANDVLLPHITAVELMILRSQLRLKTCWYKILKDWAFQWLDQEP